MVIQVSCERRNRDANRDVLELQPGHGQLRARVENLPTEPREEVVDELARVRLLADVGQLAARMAHEVRNALASVRGAAQMLEEGVKSPDGSDWTKVIMTEVDGLSKLTAEMLDFARPVQPLYAELSVTDLVRTMLEVEQLEGTSQHINFQLDLKDDVPTIESDESMLRQAIRNIINNARDSMNAGGSLKVRCFKDSRYVIVEVEDSGGGIAQDHLANIFRPFYTTKVHGTGLGLTHVEKILDMLGGRAEARNGDSGAIFSLRIPLKPIISALKGMPQAASLQQIVGHQSFYPDRQI